jgi:hypothetical protein
MAGIRRLAFCTAVATDAQPAILDFTKIRKHRRNASHVGQEHFQSSLGALNAPVVHPCLDILLLTTKSWQIVIFATSAEGHHPQAL